MHKHQRIKHKWALMAGITFLSVGIILRLAGMENYIAIPLMAAGGLLKIYFFTLQIWTGFYKPGSELLFLIIGLVIFFSGITMKYHSTGNQYFYVIASGLVLKFIFVFLYAKRIRKPTKN